ncbi:hypothetical protein FXV83_40450 [Bradyrhizobium hipponense]|uniref:DUF3644 domain-containing protein n=1 Tax=Bradyrhizobium hipponense TaxID=2605638 RepID=A0A5S4YC01_9BRAD|nr:DUF3644 domain-containing protein [Bradyrhizobium hipponense]TYO61027.1 hypothetical protein FXV83_40450 [Bradyrhizobium hipponense]
MKKPTALSIEEKRVIKSLISEGMRNQDILTLINYEREATINFGRITGIKKDPAVAPASTEETAYFKRKKRSFDPITGLNFYEDERLIRAREAMVLAVTIFNGASYKFKTEVFAVLANIAWTYLLHEYYHRADIPPNNTDGSTFALSYMLSRADCPLSKGIRKNLTSLKTIRDVVEHKMLGRSDATWLPLFQACCLNFDKTIVAWFGPRLSLQHELSVALQFGKLDLEQLAQATAYDVPPNITALDAALKKDMSEEELGDLEYQFRVVYTFDSASKGKAHIQFLSPDSAEGKTIQNVLQKFKIADELYRYKPADVVKIVRDATSKPFSMADHTRAWQKHKARPLKGSKAPEKTNRGYCIYHAAHKDYTYNDEWIALLVGALGGDIGVDAPPQPD